MEIENLEVVDFRNYVEAQVGCAPGLNALVGRNGQGKTNLLEAIHLLSVLGSHRTSSVAPLIRHGRDRAVVRAAGVAGGRQVVVDAEIGRGTGIRARVNRVPVDRGRLASRVLAAVIFSPDDLQVVKGGPEGRRRFLDHLAAGLHPSAGVERLEFERVLRQRNGALKASQSNPRARASLDVWDEQFVESAARVVDRRLECLERLGEPLARHFGSLTGAADELAAAYRSSWSDSEGRLLGDELTGAMRSAIARSRGEDIERGTCLVGPHRDDLDLRISGREARVYASQGEQRTLTLTLRLAERDAVAASQGEDPILLLDDVFSELDEERRARLAELVAESGQTIATATSMAGIPAEPARVFRVESGKVVADG